MTIKTQDQIQREKDRQQAEDRKALLQRENDWRDVLSTAAGRSVLFDVLNLTGIGDRFMEGLSTDYQNGRREVGLDVISYIEEADLEAYPKMLLENIRFHKPQEEDENE